MNLKWPLMLIAALLLCWSGCGQPVGHPDEVAAQKMIQRLRGKVEFDGTGPDRRIIKIYLHSTDVNDDDLAVLEHLPKLKNLFLGKTQISDAGLTHLMQSRELQTISLNATRVTDAGLAQLVELKDLKTVNLQDTKVTAEGAARLKKVIPGVTVAR